MKNLILFVEAFGEWLGNASFWKSQDISLLPVDPLSYPRFEEMRKCCIVSINKDLSSDEMDAFLVCMALDSEEECILDACKKHASNLFLQRLISRGVTHSQYEARWQMAELLQKDVPNRESFLHILLTDNHPYVRKRAENVKKTCDE